MKYGLNSKPLICMQTQSSCYVGTQKMTVKGILWHSTGANNSNLKRYVQPSDTKPPEDTYSKIEWLELLGKNSYGNDWNHVAKNKGPNGWIGKLANGIVTFVQTMPWDFRPWGGGSGSKGSCNDGFIQFEICEDGLADEKYFNDVYKEACEITAYLCQLFKIDPKGTTTINGVTVPTITCHQDANKLGLASNHADINHWFPKYGKSMATARDDVAALLSTSMPSTKVVYRVRKSKTDAKSQVGAYTVLPSAIEVCQNAGEGYKVFDQNWNIVYTYEPPAKPIPEETEKPEDIKKPEDNSNIDSSNDVKEDLDLTKDLDTEQLDVVSDNLAKLLFECLKKLIQMFANLFNKKGE